MERRSSFSSCPRAITGGNAVAVSNDGRLIAGNLRARRVGVSQAAVWRDGSPQILPEYPAVVGSWQ